MNSKHRQLWNQSEKDFLKKNFSKMTTKELSDHLGRSTSSVESMTYSLDLKRTTFSQIAYSRSSEITKHTFQLFGKLESKIEFALQLLK